ncbi:MAG: hypothetical protein JWN78_2541 [Bacteroidota bacterium]|nr:hypothetical protein [Bacteroidota bacterium]
MSFFLKLVEKFLGVILTITGGVVSFLPPVGAVICAQEEISKMISQDGILKYVELIVFIFKLKNIYLPRYTINTEMSDGETPEILLA